MYWFFSVLISVTYCMACYGLGMLMIQIYNRYGKEALSNRRITVSPSIGFSSLFLTGLAMYSVLLTLLGLAGQLRLYALLIISLPGLAGLLMGRSYLIEALAVTQKSLSIWKTQPIWLSAIAAVSVFLALSFAVGAWILPPKGDAAGFYMVYPKIMATTGLLEAMHGPFNYFSSIGLPVELHYTALMILADEHAAKFIIFPIALTVGVFIAGITRCCGGGIIAITMGWAMLLSSYTYYHYIFDGKVDLAAAAFGLAAVYWLLQIRGARPAVMDCAIVGWFAGLATVAKFSYLPVLGVCLVLLLVWQLSINQLPDTKKRRLLMEIGKAGSVMALVAIIAWLPQLLKNAILFDAPLAPFLGIETDSNMLEQIWFAPEVMRRILLTYPLALVFGRYPMQGGGLSFLFLAYIPFMIWLPRPVSWYRSTTVAVTVSALAAVATWMLLRPTVIAPRYILAPLLLLIPVLALAMESVMRQGNTRLLGTGIVVAVMMAIAASFWHLLPIPRAITAAVSGQDTSCMLASPECDLLEKLSAIAVPGERALVTTYYTFWLTPTLLQCRDTPEEQREIPENSLLLPWLNSHGFSYVVVDPSITEQLDADLQAIARADDSAVKRLFSGTVLNIYKLKKDQSSSVQCLEKEKGHWLLEEKLY